MGNILLDIKAGQGASLCSFAILVKVQSFVDFKCSKIWVMVRQLLIIVFMNCCRKGVVRLE